MRTKKTKKTGGAFQGHASAKESCCSTKAQAPGQCSAKVDLSVKDSCCSTKAQAPGQCSTEADTCCSGSPKAADSTKSTCGSSIPKSSNCRASNPSGDDDCCATGKDKAPAVFSKVVLPKDYDVERVAGAEFVSLSVNGMTCNDCASKLERTLKSLPGISNVRVNFIGSQADLNLDKATLTIDEMIHSVAKATGFQISQIVGSDESLELLASRASIDAINLLNIPGVINVDPVGRAKIRVVYDPIVIGSRDLVYKIGDLSQGLAPVERDGALAANRKKFYDLLIKTILAAVFTIPVVVLAWGETLVSQKTRSIVSFPLGTLVQLLAVPVFYHPALRALFLYRTLELDMLVVVSISAAYIYSVIAFSFHMAGKPLETAEFFETSTLLITLVMLGRLLASYARIRAVAAVSLRSLQAATALLVKDGDHDIDARLLQYGDIFKVLPHTKVPTDGQVLEGVSEMDESMLTGESLPVVKEPGSNVIAGTVNGSGTLLVKLTRLPGKNTVTDIAQLVEQAANSKPRIQNYADKVASWFLPVVSGISAVVFIIWVIVGLKLRDQTAAQSIAVAITYAVAVLAVSCPCALGLAVPMVLVVAGGIAARGGVIIKSADATERARRVTDVVFDKTGTLTEPELDVTAEEYIGSGKRAEILPVMKALVSDNKHPVSLAVAKHLAEYKAQPSTMDESRSVPGAGVEGVLNGKTYRAGNPRWTHHETDPTVLKLLDKGATILLITCDSEPLAVFGLGSRLRPEAVDVISTLKSRGITPHLVSGDQTKAVHTVASAVGISLTSVASLCKPEEKQIYVANLMAASKEVMFVGDGTNDAVAVAQANVGVQLNDSLSSSDVTRGAADVVLLSSLRGIPFVLDVSKAAFHRIVFNFVWSAIYNVVAILLAAGAFVKIRIAPMYAGAGELVSVLPVVFAAMSMLLLKLKA